MKILTLLFFSFVSGTLFSASKPLQGSSLLQLMQYGEKASQYLTPPVLDLSEMVIAVKTTIKTKGKKKVRRVQPIFLGNLHGWQEFIRGCDISSITILNLSLNSLCALDPGITLLSLRSLHLRDNCFKKFPQEILQLTNLIILDLSNNELEDLPYDIRALTNLKKLYCQHNKLRSLPVSLTNCTALEELRIDHNNFSDGFPDFLVNGSMPKLAIISLESNDALFHGYGIESDSITQATYDTRTTLAYDKTVRATYYGPSHPMSTTPGQRYAILVIGNNEKREDYHPIRSKEAYKSFKQILEKIKKWDKINRSSEYSDSDDETEEDDGDYYLHAVPSHILPVANQPDSDDGVDYNYDVSSSHAACGSSSTVQQKKPPCLERPGWEQPYTIASPAGDIAHKRKPSGFLTGSQSFYGGLNLLAKSSSEEQAPPADSDIDAKIEQLSREAQRIIQDREQQHPSSSSSSPREPAADSPRNPEVSTALSTAPDSPTPLSEIASPEIPPRPESCKSVKKRKSLLIPTSYEAPLNCPF